MGRKSRRIGDKERGGAKKKGEGRGEKKKRTMEGTYGHKVEDC
jgi:hypothetical protein